MGIFVLFNQILTLFQIHLDNGYDVIQYDNQFIAYPLNFPNEPSNFEPIPSQHSIELCDVNTGMDMEMSTSQAPPQPSTYTTPS